MDANDNAFIQTARVIVFVHRQQAGSYRGSGSHGQTVGASLLAMDVNVNAFMQAARVIVIVHRE